jgi:hypothetical protein
MKIFFALLIFSVAILASFITVAQWNTSADSFSSGSVTIGSTNPGSYSHFTIRGPNSPAGIGSKRQIYFDFTAAGDAAILSYRGTSWDTHLQFQTNPSTNTSGVPLTRMHIDGSGKIGIGTTSPSHNLEVTDNAGTPTFALRGALDSKLIFEPADGSDRFTIWADMDQSTWNDALRFSTATASDALAIKGDGNVGVGTTAPNAKLEVFGGSIRLSDAPSRYLNISQDAGGQPYGRGWTNVYAGGRQFKLTGWSHLPDNTGSAQKDIIHFDGYNLLLVKDNGGNLGIGTSKPDAKLTVKGNIHAEEVKVDLNVPAPDYVFEEDYELQTLQQIESYIKTNKHLPEVPSAKQMEAEGLNLKEMNLLLLKKVEEMTLYLIDQNKRITKLEEENKTLKIGKN